MFDHVEFEVRDDAAAKAFVPEALEPRGAFTVRAFPAPRRSVDDQRLDGGVQRPVRVEPLA